MVRKIRHPTLALTHAYKSISDKMQRRHEKRQGRTKMKRFPPFPSMEVTEAEVSKKFGGTEGIGGERQRLHKTSSFRKC